MNSPDSNPKLPTWIFFLTDAALLGAAWFIATRSAHPLSSQAMFAIFACIFGGALIALVPLIARYERQKNEVLDERQRELEALARTVSASAEQISIAASGLHEIAELSQKNLRHAEQLPHKLQEKIAEFQAQLANEGANEKEELEKELETLRASESERLESIAGKIAKSATDWAKLEAATHQHLSAVSEAIARLSAGTVAAIDKAQAAAEKAVDRARGEAAGTIETTTAAALAAIDARVAGAGQSVKPDDPDQPSRPRKSLRTREDAAADISKGPLEDGRAIAISAPEPSPVLAERIPQIAPVAPDTVDPFPDRAAAQPPPAIVPDPAPAAERLDSNLSAPVVPKPVRKRAARKPPADAPGLGIDESTAANDSESSESVRSGVVERVISSDGATRLLVTAYIGIGNRLFIRGEGPGLSWEKGTPLQFVSIGKWRWETNDASVPVKFKLFKNDDLECSALGAQSLDPGQQQEVTAAF